MSPELSIVGHLSQISCLKPAFHDADTDTDTDVLTRMSARMSVSASRNAGFNCSTGAVPQQQKFPSPKLCADGATVTMEPESLDITDSLGSYYAVTLGGAYDRAGVVVSQV